MNAAGWIVTAIAVLLTSISKSGLGGALGTLAFGVMSETMVKGALGLSGVRLLWDALAG